MLSYPIQCIYDRQSGQMVEIEYTQQDKNLLGQLRELNIGLCGYARYLLVDLRGYTPVLRRLLRDKSDRTLELRAAHKLGLLARAEVSLEELLISSMKAREAMRIHSSDEPYTIVGKLAIQDYVEGLESREIPRKKRNVRALRKELLLGLSKIQNKEQEDT